MSDKKNQSQDTSSSLPERSDAAYWRKRWGGENSPIRFPEPSPDGGRDESVVIIGGFRNPFVSSTKKKEAGNG